LFGINHPLAAFLPMFFLTFSNGLAIPNAVAGAVSINPALAGTASGLSGFIQVMGGVLMTILTGHLVSQSVISLLIVLTVMGAAAVFFASRVNRS
jgi:DHA1 family bicyclomycin/chloramphenicol resistance-like MFS transporter